MVREILLESNVVPIFAVTSNEKAIYEVKVNLCTPRKTGHMHVTLPYGGGGGIPLHGLYTCCNLKGYVYWPFWSEIKYRTRKLIISLIRQVRTEY